MGDTQGVVTRFLGHKIVPDLDADRSGSCSMFVEMVNIATKPLSCDSGLVAILAISTRMSKKSLLIWNVCIISLCIGRDTGLT